MAFRGIFDIPGQGKVPVYDFESEVPESLRNQKVGIVESTASSDLRNSGVKVFGTHSSPFTPTAIFWKMLIVLIVVVGAVLITLFLTHTSIQEFDTDGDGIPDIGIISGPGWATTVDLRDGSVIDKSGEPLAAGISNIVNAVVIGTVVVVGAVLLFKFVIPALSKRKGTSRG